jgi:hypothetical protein
VNHIWNKNLDGESMTTFELVDGDHLDYDAFVNLQRTAYADLLAELKVSNVYMSSEFYRWKFHPPAGPAKIVIVREGNRMVSTNAMIPVELRLGQHTIHGWQACDAATLVTAREKGYSSGCLRTLFESLKTNEVLFLFPNKASVRYVESMGSQNKGIITTWVKPSPLLKKRSSPNVRKITRFGKGQDRLAERLADCGKVLVSRSADYLNWRYSNHPVYEYVSFMYQEENEQQGYAVIRRAEVLGRNVALIMELWGLTSLVKKALLRSIAQWTVEQHIKWIVLQDNDQSLLGGLRMGFIAAPAWVLPKKQVLLVFAAPGKLSEKIVNSDWWVQIGDWDGF